MATSTVQALRPLFLVGLLTGCVTTQTALHLPRVQEKGAESAPAVRLVLPSISLQTGFDPDPQIGRGIAGGPVDGPSLDPTCAGKFSDVPSQTLNLTSNFQALQLVAVSVANVSLMVVSPTGSRWCNDDQFGTDASVTLSNVTPGKYEVYVGNQSTSPAPEYSLIASERERFTPAYFAGLESYRLPHVTLAENDPPRFGTVNVTASFRPYQFDGSTGGSQHAANVPSVNNEDCNGWVTAAPSFTLHVAVASRLKLAVRSGADTTLVVRLPGVQRRLWCHDDVGKHGDADYSMNPEFEEDFEVGDYGVWVGGYNEAEVRPFRFSVTKVRSR